MSGSPTIRAFFDEPTNTISYLIAEPKTKRAAIVDRVLDYDHASGKASTRSADIILKPPRPTISPSTGCSRPMPMPTISLARPISS
jgi:hypothetical protein